MSRRNATAARILLAANLTDDERKAALSHEADQAAIEAGELCPECFRSSIEWNGHRGRWAEYRCTDCDHRFGPGAEA